MSATAATTASHDADPVADTWLPWAGEVASPPGVQGRPAVYALHHVQLAMPAGEEDRARAFYGAVLGMEEVEKPPVLAARGGCWFRAGVVEIHLGVEDPFQPARKAHPGILVEDLDEVRARLHADGVEVRPDDEMPGYHRFYTDDCFGNRLEFLEAEWPASP